MRDFDQERAERANLDHTFKIGGQVFRFRNSVRGEVYARWADLLDGTLRAHYPIPGEVDEKGEPILIYRPPTQAEVVKILDDLALEHLEPESHGAWKAAREHADDPLTYEEAVSLIAYMVSVQNGRPTMPATSSGAGAGTPSNGTQSTAVSPQPAAT